MVNSCIFLFFPTPIVNFTIAFFRFTETFSWVSPNKILFHKQQGAINYSKLFIRMILRS